MLIIIPNVHFGFQIGLHGCLTFMDLYDSWWITQPSLDIWAMPFFPPSRPIGMAYLCTGVGVLKPHLTWFWTAVQKKHKSTTISKLTECGRIMKDAFLLKYILLYIPRFDAESSMYPIKSYHFDGPWGDFCTHNMSSSGMNSKGFIQPRKGTSLVRTNLDGGTDHEPSNPKLSSLPKHLLHLSVGVERFHWHCPVHESSIRSLWYGGFPK